MRYARWRVGSLETDIKKDRTPSGDGQKKQPMVEINGELLIKTYSPDRGKEEDEGRKEWVEMWE